MARNRFAKGNKLGGKPKGAISKRAAILRTLEAFLKDPANQETIQKQWAHEMEENFLEWWRTIVQPNLPKQIKLDGSLDIEPEEASAERAELLVLLKSLLAKGNGNTGEVRDALKRSQPRRS